MSQPQLCDPPPSPILHSTDRETEAQRDEGMSPGVRPGPRNSDPDPSVLPPRPQAPTAGMAWQGWGLSSIQPGRG